jgi:acyl-CoA reductase-like NAD-dependent aldehyde dehydrogenase
VSDYTMTIDGTPVLGDKTFAVTNPATEALAGEAPDCTEAQLELAMTTAQKALRDWRDDLELRRSVMHAAADAMEQAAEELGYIETLEQGGVPLAAAIGRTHHIAHKFRHYAELEIERVVVQDDEQALIEIARRPLGVIAAIKPWNVPLVMAINTIAPAFRAGCTVVLKPSPYTPLATLRLGEVLREVVPPGVLNVISGLDPLGQAMVEHPIPRGISFTGSVATGKKVNVTAAADLKRVLLELGGNDPAIVLDDVDPERVADQIFQGAFANVGQICMAIKRVYVPESLHDAIVEALAKRARTVHLGNGLDEETEMGPLNNRPQYERIRALVDEAVTDGATAVAGGHEVEGDGYFFEPTILTGAREGMRIVDEEQFGPALPILTYREVSEAIERANATTYGLGSSVWSNDPVRAQAVAEQLETGSAWVNTHMALGLEQPFQGMKWSGLGSENGVWSVYAYTEVQTVYRSRSGPTTYIPTA